MRPRALIAAVVLALFAGACSVTSSVATERADRIGAGLPADQSADQTDPSAPPASSAPVEEPTTPDDEPTSAPTTDVVDMGMASGGLENWEIRKTKISTSSLTSTVKVPLMYYIRDFC